MTSPNPVRLRAILNIYKVKNRKALTKACRDHMLEDMPTSPTMAPNDWVQQALWDIPDFHEELEACRDHTLEDMPTSPATAPRNSSQQVSWDDSDSDEEDEATFVRPSVRLEDYDDPMLRRELEEVLKRERIGRPGRVYNDEYYTGRKRSFDDGDDCSSSKHTFAAELKSQQSLRKRPRLRWGILLSEAKKEIGRQMRIPPKKVEFYEEVSVIYSDGTVREISLAVPADLSSHSDDFIAQGEDHAGLTMSNAQQREEKQMSDAESKARLLRTLDRRARILKKIYDGDGEPSLQQKKQMSEFTRCRRIPDHIDLASIDLPEEDTFFELPSTAANGKRKRIEDDEPLEDGDSASKRKRAAKEAPQPEDRIKYQRQDPAPISPGPSSNSHISASDRKVQSPRQRISELQKEPRELKDELGGPDEGRDVKNLSYSAAHVLSTSLKFTVHDSLRPGSQQHDRSEAGRASTVCSNLKPRKRASKDFSPVAASTPRPSIKRTRDALDKETGTAGDKDVSTPVLEARQVNKRARVDRAPRVHEQEKLSDAVKANAQPKFSDAERIQAHDEVKGLLETSVLNDADKANANINDRATGSEDVSTPLNEPHAMLGASKENAGNHRTLNTGPNDEVEQSRVGRCEISSANVSNGCVNNNSNSGTSSSSSICNNRLFPELRACLGKRKWGNDDEMSKLMQPTQKRRRTKVPIIQATCSPFATEILLQSSMTTT